MAEFIYSATPPTTIGTFDAEKAQALATASSNLIDDRYTAYLRSPDILRDVDLDIYDSQPFGSNGFINSASTYAEYLPGVLGTKSDAVNKWHADILFDVTQNPATFNLVPVTIGSSSHSTEIICGDVAFAKDITSSKNYDKYLLTEAGQRAISLALQKGDAWVHVPEDGHIVSFSDANLHRRNQSDPVDSYRLVVRQH